MTDLRFCSSSQFLNFLLEPSKLAWDCPVLSCNVSSLYDVRGMLYAFYKYLLLKRRIKKNKHNDNNRFLQIVFKNLINITRIIGFCKKVCKQVCKNLINSIMEINLTISCNHLVDNHTHPTCIHHGDTLF
jgi:hypothetical protein